MTVPKSVPKSARGLVTKPSRFALGVSVQTLPLALSPKKYLPRYGGGKLALSTKTPPVMLWQLPSLLPAAPACSQK